MMKVFHAEVFFKTTSDTKTVRVSGNKWDEVKAMLMDSYNGVHYIHLIDLETIDHGYVRPTE
jgi:hypothetical protein